MQKKRELSLQFKLDSSHGINKFREKKDLENPVDQLLANCFLSIVLVEIRPNYLNFPLLSLSYENEGQNTTDAMIMLPGPHSAPKLGIIFEYCHK